MTIVDTCAALLDARSPRTLAELASSCVQLGATRSRSPENAVAAAVRGDARVVEGPDQQYWALGALLEGRWFTTRAAVDDRVTAGLDVAPLLDAFADRDLPVGAGVAQVRDDGIAGPPGWLPPHGGLVALAVRGGALHVRSAVLDEEAAARGHDLAERVRLRAPQASAWSVPTPFDVQRRLAVLLAADDRLLREAVAPLSELLPEAVRRPAAEVLLGEPLQVRLTQALQSRLVGVAGEAGVPLETWLHDELVRLSWSQAPVWEAGTADDWEREPAW